MKRTIFAATLLSLGFPALAQLPDEVAVDAYIYAYSIDEAYKFCYEAAVKTGTPLNRFQNIRLLANDTYIDHRTINDDTLHLIGWLDLTAEPMIGSVPDMARAVTRRP